MFEQQGGARLVDATLREERLALLCILLPDLADGKAELAPAAIQAILRQTAERLTQAAAAVGNALPMEEAQNQARVASTADGQFAILLSGVRSADDATEAANAVRGAFQEPLIARGKSIALQPRIGIAQFPGDADNVAALLEAAATAANAADPETQISHFTDTVHASTLSRLDFAKELEWAIEQKQLELLYQPRIDLRSGELIAVEALLRWFHPVGGSIPLEELLPLAEATGLIVPIGDWVLQSACEQIAAWATEPALSHLRVSVNLSHHEFLRPELSELVPAARCHTLAGRASPRQ